MNDYENVKVHGLLAELAYLKLESENFINPKTKEKLDYHNNSHLVNFINQGKEISDIDISHQKLMTNLLKDYEIVDFKSDDGLGESDFQGMLLKEKATGEYVIAFRGTDGKMDAAVDAGMANPILNHNFQLNEAKDFVNDMKEKYNISNDNLTLTGHSLGGILVQQVAATEHIKGYTYNAMGADELIKFDGTSSVSPGGIVERGLDAMGVKYNEEGVAFVKENVHNISYQDSGTLNGDPLSNLGTNLNGSAFLSNVLPIYGDNKSFDAHSIIGLNDTIAQQNQTLKHFKGADLATLNDVYRVAGYEKTQEIFKELGVEESSPRSLRLETLHDKEIAEYDLQDPATLYALEHLNPFVVEGNLDAYKEISIENYSKEQLEDRIMLYQSQYHEEVKHTRYVDMETEVSSGYGNIRHQVVFGDEKNNTLYGKDGDHLYGNEGNDVLHAERVGYHKNIDSHLEGGKGMDTLYGGRGDDTLIGGYGSGLDDNAVDVLYGGEGFDTYYVNNKDIIQDSDGVGRVVFNGISLRGEKQKLDEKNYVDAHFNYALENETGIGELVVTDRKTNESITIAQYDASKAQLGMVFDKEKIIEPVVKKKKIQHKHKIQQDPTYNQTLKKRIMYK